MTEPNTFGVHSTEQPKQSPDAWTKIQELLSRQMFDEAFAMILRKGTSENEDMLLIRAIGKLGCKYHLFFCNCCVAFCVNKLSESVRTELFKRSLLLIENCEFTDTFLPCFLEASSHMGAISLAAS